MTDQDIYMSNVRILTGECKNIVDNPVIQFKFKPDEFQKHSFYCISKDENILVTAHTGSGKTAVAEYATMHYISKGQKVIYTSPIKALSNQKYKEFKIKFEDEHSKILGRQITVGLMTGDNKIKPDADCVIMTTEILRNALYDIGDKTKYFENDFLSSLGCVIFDEVHYINDKDRGRVWEETIVLLNNKITLVMLSATIDKPEQFAQWIANKKQKIVNLIPTSFRFVPLEHNIYVSRKLYRIMDNSNTFFDEEFDNACREFKLEKKIDKNISHKAKLNELILYLKEKNLLQAIFFSFSRLNCEKYAKSLNVDLLDHTEKSEVEKIFSKYMHKYQKQYEHIGQYYLIKDLMLKGVAYHHSGLVPILKEVVEIIFQQGLIKILFATETFAVGINMPTRTIVFTELEKPTFEGRRLLTTEEYKQMSGRAGRRGLDKIGHVIILPQYDFPDKQALKSVALGKIKSIRSKFDINYSFLLKILQSRSSKFEDFINDSLFKQDTLQYLESEKKNKDSLKTQIDTMKDKFSNNINILQQFIKYDTIDSSLENLTVRVSLNKKQQKEKANLLKEINRNPELKKLCDEYKIFLNLEKELFQIENNIYECENHISNRTQLILQVLMNFGYIKDMSMTQDSITLKGILAGQINECNPIILTEMISRNMFNDMTTEEIVALLSIFIEDTKKDNPISIDNITCSTKVLNKLYEINDVIDEFADYEYSIGLDIVESWDIYYDYVDISYNWASGASLESVMAKLETYEGNFVRNMLKISNIAKDLVFLSYTCGNLSIIPQLEQIDKKIIRDIVTINSLYINAL